MDETVKICLKLVLICAQIMILILMVLFDYFLDTKIGFQIDGEGVMGGTTLSLHCNLSLPGPRQRFIFVGSKSFYFKPTGNVRR